MSADNEKLWVVERLHPHALYVFRTRAAARKFVDDAHRSNGGEGYDAKRDDPHHIHRATWGPEQ